MTETTQQSNEFISSDNDIREFFDNCNILYAYKIIDTLPINESVYFSLFNNNVIIFDLLVKNPIKNLNHKYIFNYLENSSIYLKSSIPQNKQTNMKKEFIKKIQTLANKNCIFKPAKPGLTLLLNSSGCPLIKILDKNHFTLFFPDSVPKYMFYTNPPTSNKRIVTYSETTLLLLSIRYLSLLLPLKFSQCCNFYIGFPFILTFQYYNNASEIIDILERYLAVFTNPQKSNQPYTALSLNSPPDVLYKAVNERKNNVLIIDGSIDFHKIRNENIKILEDFFTSQSSDCICCIVSNTVQQKLSPSSFINIDLRNTTNAVYDYIIFNTIDKYFITHLNNGYHNIFLYETSANLSPNSCEIYNKYAEFFENNYRSSPFNDNNKKMAEVSLKCTFEILCHIFDAMIFIENTDNVKSTVKNYINSLFSQYTPQLGDINTFNKFRTTINNMLLNNNLQLVPNDKSNKNMIFSSLENIIYSNNNANTIFITDEIMQYLCDVSNINIRNLKKSLKETNHLISSDELNVSKVTLYPPGNPPIRKYVYILRNDIVNKDILDYSNRKAFYSLTYSSHTQKVQNGTVIGYDYENNPIIWSYNALPTSHLMITGRSGFGKTTLITRLITQINKNDPKKAIIVFDISKSYASNEQLKKSSNTYNKLPVNPFTPYKNEPRSIYIKRIVRNLSNSFNIDSNTSEKLSEIIAEAYNEKSGILKQKIYDMAKSEKKSSIRKICNFIYNVLEGSEDRKWSNFDKKKITVINLNDNYESYEITAEFLLNDLYDFQKYNNSGSYFVVIDEIQNLVNMDSNAIIQILSQGRDKNIGLILSTQSFKTIPSKYRSMFLQSSLAVFFQSEINYVEQISKLIHSDNSVEKVASLLKKIDKGHFLVYGMLEDKSGTILSDRLIYASNQKHEFTVPQTVNSQEINVEIPIIDLGICLYNSQQP